MYNAVAPDQIPPFLPIAGTVLLKTWFDEQIIEQGMALLRKGSLSHFFICRNGAACMMGNNRLTLVFERTDRITQGFTIKEEHCELCGFSKRGKRCEHIAALCILSLHEKSARLYVPLPLEFKQSVWGITADILYDWLSREKGTARFTRSGHMIKIQKKTQNGSICAICDQTGSSSAAVLDTDDADHISPLFEKLQQRCTTKNEQLLIKAGATSKGAQQDSSVWTRLCTLAYCRIGDTPPQISYSSEKGCFQLELDDIHSGLQINADLPKSYSFEILKKLGKIGESFHKLPDGRPGSDVSLTAGGKIVVSPIVWLADGRVMRISDLDANKFGNHYYLPEEGFFSISGNDSNAKILTNSSSKKQASLFDILRKDDEAIVEHADIADFLERNKERLHHPDNQVAPEILSIRFTNVPDRLVIIEVREEEKEGWIMLNCRFTIGEEDISLAQLQKTLFKKQPLTAGFTTLELQEGPLSWLPGLLTGTGGKTRHDPQNGIRLSRGEFATLIGTVPCIECTHDNSDLQQKLARLTAPESHNILNSTIRYQNHLRDYQKNGITWLFTLYELGLGGILADDMGLGKTHQALSLIEAIIQNSTGSMPVLIVCPASVLLHWADKIDRFYPELHYAIYYGPNRNLETALRQRVILTTYAITRADCESLTQCQFGLIVYDEIQALKNRSTATHQACRAFRTRVAIGLSGTPIENSLEDLFSIFSICLPGFFGSFKSFEHTFISPIEKRGSPYKEQQLTERISPFVLRRSRAQVLVELPELIEDDRSCELSEEQLELYRQTISSRQPLLAEIADKSMRIDYLHVFAMLTRLKQICNHPCLIEKCTDPKRYASGKWELFVELLDECLDSGRKIVVFSQYLGMLDIIDHYLSEMNIGFATLRGDMGVAKRQRMIDTFETDANCRVFTASLLAGGAGIDLISGNAVIHYDRWWNPAKENQATARVHRMGQKDVVHLFRLSTRDTLEEKIDSIISEKKHLSEAIIREDELGMIQRLSREQLLELFSI